MYSRVRERLLLPSSPDTCNNAHLFQLLQFLYHGAQPQIFECFVGKSLTQKVISQKRVNVLIVGVVGQIAFLGDSDELSVVPVEHENAVRFTLYDVRVEIIVEPRP